jgi:hypothetical protein
MEMKRIDNQYLGTHSLQFLAREGLYSPFGRDRDETRSIDRAMRRDELTKPGIALLIFFLDGKFKHALPTVDLCWNQE